MTYANNVLHLDHADTNSKERWTRRPFNPSEIDDYGLTPNEFRVYYHILRRASGERGCFEAMQAMAERCLLNIKTLRRILKVLVSANVVTCENQGSNKPAIFRPLPFQYWVENINKVREAICSTKNGRAKDSGCSTKNGRAGVPKTDRPALPKTDDLLYQNRSTKETNIRKPIEGNQSKGIETLTHGLEVEVKMQGEEIKMNIPDQPKNQKEVSVESTKDFDQDNCSREIGGKNYSSERVAGGMIPPAISHANSRAAPPAFTKNGHTHPAVLMEQRLNRDKEPPSYRISWETNNKKSLKPDFVEFVRQRQEFKYGRRTQTEDAIGWIVNREPGGKNYTTLSEQLDVVVKDWQESQQDTNQLTEGERLAQQLDSIQNKPTQNDDRYVKVGGKYKWESAPGVPLEHLLQWYAGRVGRSKRPELSGKSALQIAWDDLQRSHEAAIIYEDWKEYVTRQLNNQEISVPYQTQPPVAAPPEPQPKLETLSSRIERYQKMLDSGYPFLVIQVKRLIEEDPQLELNGNQVEVAF